MRGRVEREEEKGEGSEKTEVLGLETALDLREDIKRRGRGEGGEGEEEGGGEGGRGRRGQGGRGGEGGEKTEVLVLESAGSRSEPNLAKAANSRTGRARASWYRRPAWFP